ncbi:TetR/AcrR family transcriptional regulator [Candidatus Uabimicrobium sp. HlEnr_7]|uniref:TetR/AcrR family transcriptional regulator n=1 Tax=Candidatus Uabimicrobium helgolandensis TaxID=3095367 RepID=UPI0035590DD0
MAQQKKITYETLYKVMEIFFRYGYKKTSLDDIAQSIGVSRQALYKHYKNKTDLFKSAVAAMLEESLVQSKNISEDASINLEDKLLNLFDIWSGQYVNIVKSHPHASEVIDATHSLIGDIVFAKQQQFISIVTDVLKDQCKSKKTSITTKQTSETLFYTAKGICLYCENRNDYKEKMHIAISLICNSYF